MMSIISILFICFQIMDGATTFIGLTAFTVLEEANPLQQCIGWPGFITFKVLITIGVVWVAEHWKWYTPIKFVAVMMALVVINNLVRILLVS